MGGVSCACFLCRDRLSSADTAVPASAPQAASGKNYIDALLASGGNNFWGSVRGGATVSYSFLQTVPSVYEGEDEAGTFSPFSSQQRVAVREIFGKWSEVCNINFNEKYSTEGQITFGNAQISEGTAAFAFYPDTTYYGGDVWVNSIYDSYDAPSPGDFYYATLIHEIGHALGLKHPGNYNVSGGGTEGPYLPSWEDNAKYTVMSYNNHPYISDIQPLSPLLYDIAAIQYLYGANKDTRADDTRYFWASGASVITAIWDGGGTDLLDASNQTGDQVLDLRAGAFSSIAGKKDNVAIAYGAVIENASGGAGADRIIGNDSNNILAGGAGYDTYVCSGAWGRDLIRDIGANAISLDLLRSNVKLRREGRNLKIINKIQGGEVVVEAAFDSDQGGAHQNWTIITTDGRLDLSNVGDNIAPVVTTRAGSAYSRYSSSCASYFSIADANGDSVTQYQFWDSSDRAGGAYFSVKGATQAANTLITVNAADLSSTYVYGGAVNGSDTLWVRAYDGEAWSDWASWTVATVGGNDPPKVTTKTGQSVVAHRQIGASAMFSVADANYNAITAYEFWDSTDRAGSGYFSVAGSQQGANRVISVSAAQLSSTYFIGGGGGTDLVWVRAYDGSSWSEWESWEVKSKDGQAPTVSIPVSTVRATSGGSSLASSMFSATDGDGDSLTAYEFWDSTSESDSGYFRVAGVKQAAERVISVSASQLSSTYFVAGASRGTDKIWVRAFDGYQWSGWTDWRFETTTGNVRPVVVASDRATVAGATVSLPMMFTVADSDNAVMKSYELWDAGDAFTSGYFSLAGVKQGARRVISATAAELATATYTAGAASTTEKIWVRAYDGTGWSDWAGWNMTVAAAAAMADEPYSLYKPAQNLSENAVTPGA